MDSHEVRRQWAERSGEYSPEYYAYYGPDDTSETVHALLDRFVGRDARVLELGCSSGRHLSHLHEEGFEDLSGIEVNDDALDVMEEVYPDLADAGTFYLDAIEDVVGDFADDRFDAVYSVETLQHLHPDAEWVYAELARITAGLLVTVENEGEGEHEVNYVDDDVPLYYRDWNRVFTDVGCVEVAVERGKRDTVRAFRPPRE
ncbi:class I SAM-dependent methyltransferase [Halomarina ordinaria]|uniref:Class I SAM-dependent methyltransferase n=1 Tax=Halomarina ordinaria TaxID=3033939 RepID=A0ABD5U4T5_9EURY|nr:class I SAM-dependent methyltransferase [Halomarina sp. PSRA2]